MPATTAALTAAPPVLDHDGNANPAYADWVRDRIFEHCRVTGQHPAVYFPEAFDKDLGNGGAWIMVTAVPRVPLSGFTLPRLSIWRATTARIEDSGKVLIGGTRTRPQYAPQRPKLARILTPGGELLLWHHEYVVVDNLAAIAGHPDVTVHRLDGSDALTDVEDELFYLMSRGLTREQAVMLLIDRVTGDQWGWFEPNPAYATALLR